LGRRQRGRGGLGRRQRGRGGRLRATAERQRRLGATAERQRRLGATAERKRRLGATAERQRRLVGATAERQRRLGATAERQRDGREIADAPQHFEKLFLEKFSSNVPVQESKGRVGAIMKGKCESNVEGIVMMRAEGECDSRESAWCETDS
jgi:hypothetical protein